MTADVEHHDPLSPVSTFLGLFQATDLIGVVNTTLAALAQRRCQWRRRAEQGGTMALNPLVGSNPNNLRGAKWIRLYPV